MGEPIRQPAQVPSERHEVVVVLETIHFPVPDFDTSPSTYEVISYNYTTAKDDVSRRLQNASIVILVTCPINAQTLGDSPHLYV
jgi:hypothetical protein